MTTLTLNKAMEVLGFAVDDSMSLLSDDVRDSAKLVLKELRDQIAAKSIPEMMQELHASQATGPGRVEIFWDDEDEELRVMEGFLQVVHLTRNTLNLDRNAIGRVLEYLTARYLAGAL